MFIFDSLVLVISSEIESIKIEINEDINIDFDNFKSIYQEIFNEEEKSGKYFLDFSDVFNKLIELNEDAEVLMNIKEIYKKELNIFPDKNIENKLKENIHKSGIHRIRQGIFNNDFLIRFLKNDCCEKYQNFDLLKYFKIELMDDKFFEQFNKNEIYSLFKINFHDYLIQFSTNIKEIKYFGIFFKILPTKYYTFDTITIIFNWLKRYINTFDFSKCKNFKDELFKFFNILAINKLNNAIEDLAVEEDK